MQIRTILIGVFALIFGISAAVGVYMLGHSPSASPSKIETVSVVVAASDIERGQTLSAELLSQRDWPKEMVPEGAITDAKEFEDRTVVIPLVKGDLLLMAKLAAKGAGRGLAAVIPPGKRAVTIQTPNVATGVAGFIVPGNKVDILLTMSHQGADDQTGGGSTITLLQNVEILAVDQRVDVPQDNKMDAKELRSVTLLVTPAESARLDLGQNKGTLRLTLRNPADKSSDYVDPVTLSGLSLKPSDTDGTPSAPSPASVTADVPAASTRKAATSLIRTMRGTRSSFITVQAAQDAPSSD